MLSTKFGTGWMMDSQHQVVAPTRMRVMSQAPYYWINTVERAHRRITSISKLVTRAEEIQVTDEEQGSNGGIMDVGKDDTEVTNQEVKETEYIKMKVVGQDSKDIQLCVKQTTQMG